LTFVQPLTDPKLVVVRDICRRCYGQICGWIYVRKLYER